MFAKVLNPNSKSQHLLFIFHCLPIAEYALMCQTVQQVLRICIKVDIFDTYWNVTLRLYNCQALRYVVIDAQLAIEFRINFYLSELKNDFVLIK